MSGLFDKPTSPFAGPFTPKPESTPQVSFNDVVKEIHAQNTCIQILEQQRETITQALLQAKVQLLKVQEQAQVADQRTNKIMGLVSQQWAGRFRGARGTPTGLVRWSFKIEIFTDPGTYDGSKAKFKDWWTKIKAWLDCNPKQCAYIDVNRDEIINSKNCAYAILSSLLGPKESHFAEVEL